ncbi:MAG TPA: hypothetical protein VGK52_11935 [Polyangia bacterium]|jgi:hypothetical protein
MNKRTLLGILAAGGLALAISCDGGSSATSTGLDANDCPYGTFRPAGLTDCVFPATDVNNQPFGVSDNRCAAGQPAVPPQCVSDAGDRAYLSTSSKCATGYRFLPGACNRNEGIAGTAGTTLTGTAGSTTGFGTGAAGTGTGFGTGAAGDSSTTGAAGEGGSFGTGTGGSDVTGTAGGVGGMSGASGTGGSANAGGVDASDGAAE